MHLTHLSLRDFRSYPEVELPLDPGITTFVGPNGQGKTNLVEAVGYLATLGSHRVAQDAPLVRVGCLAGLGDLQQGHRVIVPARRGDDRRRRESAQRT